MFRLGLLMKYFSCLYSTQQKLYIWGVGSLGWIVRGSGCPCSCYSCLTWMVLECTCGLSCPPSLWQNWVPGFPYVSGYLSSGFHPGWLPPVSLWGIGAWAKIHYFLFIPTSLCFPVFPLLTPQRYSTFEWCLLGLLLNNSFAFPNTW